MHSASQEVLLGELAAHLSFACAFGADELSGDVGGDLTRRLALVVVQIRSKFLPGSKDLRAVPVSCLFALQRTAGWTLLQVLVLAVFSGRLPRIPVRSHSGLGGRGEGTAGH